MSRPPEALRVVIADDEPLARRRLRALLRAEPSIEQIVETGDGPATIDVVREQRPDVLFLDVRMPGADGIEVLEAVGRGVVGAVVLVSAFDSYGVAAFDHRVLDYVLKPVDEDRFRETLARVRERLTQRFAAHPREDVLPGGAGTADGAAGEAYLTRIIVRTARTRAVVPVSDIDWIGARRDYLMLHAGRQVFVYRSTMGALERRLDPAAFVRIHRSTIVRLDRVRQLEPYFHGDYSLTLQDGTRLRLSRTYRTRLQAALGHTHLP